MRTYLSLSLSNVQLVTVNMFEIKIFYHINSQKYTKNTIKSVR